MVLHTKEWCTYERCRHKAWKHQYGADEQYSDSHFSGYSGVSKSTYTGCVTDWNVSQY